MTFNKDDQQLHQYLLLTSNHKTIMTDGDGNPKPDLDIQNPAWTYKTGHTKPGLDIQNPAWTYKTRPGHTKNIAGLKLLM